MKIIGKKQWAPRCDAD